MGEEHRNFDMQVTRKQVRKMVGKTNNENTSKGKEDI